MPKVGRRVMLAGVRAMYRGDANRGVVVGATAPGMRRVRWDDGTEQDVYEGEVVEEVSAP